MTPLRVHCDQKLLCSSIGHSRSISPNGFGRLGKEKNSNILSSKKLLNKNKKGGVAKPPPFKLKDLPVYSKTLKMSDIDSLRMNKLLDPLGKRNKKNGSLSESRQRSPNRNIEWTKTPVYRQFVLKLNEMESLEDGQIGIRRYKKRNQKKTLRQIDLDLKNKQLMKQLLEETLKNIYSEQEVQYFITILKNKTLEGEEMQKMVEKVEDTLEVLMCKLGLKDQFERMVDSYESEFKEDLRETLIKLLCRCKIMYGSIQQIKTIFKIMKQRENLEATI